MTARQKAPKGPKFILRQIPLDRQGYTKGKYPRYYGTGAPLFSVEVDYNDLDNQLVAAGFSRDLFKGITDDRYVTVLERAGASEQARRVRAIIAEDGQEFRATDRNAAKDRLRAKFPGARF